MIERIPCCVPFCPRTTSAERIAPNNEWICAQHWRRVDRRRRRVYARAKRRFPPGTFTIAVIWSRLRAEAIEKAL